MSIQTSTSTAQALNYVMGALVTAGGVAGYATAGSQASLISGGSIGALFMLSGYLGQPLMGAAVGAVLALVMGNRYAETKRFMPAGLLAGVGAGAALYNVYLAQYSSVKLKV